MKSIFICLCLFIGLGLQASNAIAETAAEDPAHNELRVLRDNALAALNSGNIDELLKYVSPNIVFTGLDNRVSHSSDEIRAYFNKMMTGPDRVVNAVHFDTKVEALTILLGTDKTTGISYGTSHDTYSLKGGLDFDINTRWTATLVKEGGHWMIASFHASADLFDNPLLNQTKKMLIWVGLACLLGGLIVGVFIMWLTRRNKSAKAV